MFHKSKKKEEEEEYQPKEQDQTTAAITYYYDASTEEIKIDVAVKDYNPEIIDDLCKILNVLSNDKAYIETVNIIQMNLSDNKDCLTRFLINVSKQANKTFLNKLEDVVMNQPCIRPSDML